MISRPPPVDRPTGQIPDPSEQGPQNKVWKSRAQQLQKAAARVPGGEEGPRVQELPTLNPISLLCLRTLLRAAGAQSGGEPHGGRFWAQMIPCTETPAAAEAPGPGEAALDSQQPPGLPEPGPEVAEFLYSDSLRRRFPFPRGGRRGPDRGFGPRVSRLVSALRSGSSGSRGSSGAGCPRRRGDSLRWDPGLRGAAGLCPAGTGFRDPLSGLL